MANFVKHAGTAAIVGVSINVCANIFKQLKKMDEDSNVKFDWHKLMSSSLFAAGMGAVCGVLPDILEPATTPNHRKFFHSIFFGSAIGYGLFKSNSSTNSKEDKLLINIAGACYLSHLCLDSKTAKGLPLVA